MFYWLCMRAKYEVGMSYDSNFMEKVKKLTKTHTRCPEFHSDPQKYYKCVDENSS